MDSAGLAARASTSIWSPIVPTLELEDAEEIEAAEWEEEALAPSSSLPAEVASCCVGMMTGQCTPCAQKRGRLKWGGIGGRAWRVELEGGVGYHALRSRYATRECDRVLTFMMMLMNMWFFFSSSSIQSTQLMRP